MARVNSIELIGGPLDGQKLEVKCQLRRIPPVLFVHVMDVGYLGKRTLQTTLERCGFRAEHGGVCYQLASSSESSAFYCWDPQWARQV
jgi:hypothetical protein